jgi:hypothetical protein
MKFEVLTTVEVVVMIMLMMMTMMIWVTMPCRFVDWYLPMSLHIVTTQKNSVMSFTMSVYLHLSTCQTSIFIKFGIGNFYKDLVTDLGVISN